MTGWHHGLTIVVMAITFPDLASAQSVALGTGVMIPVGESRDISDRAQNVSGTIVIPSRFAAIDARIDALFWRSLSHIVPGAVAQTFALSAGANVAVPTARSIHATVGIGAYRSDLSPAPFEIRTTTDLALIAGLGGRFAIGRRLPGAARLGWLRRLDVFVESRLHHVLSDVSPSDFVDVTGGISLRRR